MKREKTKINLSADDRKKLNKFVSKGMFPQKSKSFFALIFSFAKAHF
jgi:hypothetical protein